MRKYIFGVGKGKDIVIKCLRIYDIDAYLDNNEELYKQVIDGKSVKNISEISKKSYVLISVMNYKDIYKQLLEAGFEEKHVIPFFSLKALRTNIFFIDHSLWLKEFYKWSKRKFLNQYSLFKKGFSPIWRAHIRAQNEWNKNNGENTLRVDYNLTSESIVFDLGGYKGDFTNKIIEKFDCYVYTFEPVPDFAMQIKKRFENNCKVKVYNYGLEDKNSLENLILSMDGSSVYKRRGKKIQIKYREASDFIEKNNIKRIDLMKINIEGGEYSLLEHLLETKKIQIIDNVQIQFHDKKIHGTEVAYSKERMRKIIGKLEETHELSWAYRPGVFESWHRKEV